MSVDGSRRGFGAKNVVGKTLGAKGPGLKNLSATISELTTPRAEREEPRPALAAHRCVFALDPGTIGDGEPGLRSRRIVRATRGFPRSVLRLCDPSALGPRLAPGAEEGVLVRPVCALQAPGDAAFGDWVLLQRVWRRRDDDAPDAPAARSDDVESVALLMRPADYAAATSALLPGLKTALALAPQEGEARAPSGPDVDGLGASVELQPRLIETDDDIAAAARLIATLQREGPLRPLALADIGGVDGFWRAAAAALDAFPESLRPLLSLSSGFRADAAPPSLSCAPDAASLESDLTHNPVEALNAREALDRARRVLTGEWRLSGSDPGDALADLRGLLQDGLGGAGQSDLLAFLVDRDAPEPTPPTDAPGRAAYLRRLVAAVDVGVAFRRDVPEIGSARAAALLACTTDDVWRDAWASLRATQPARAFWSATLLRTPDWIPDEAIGSLGALARLTAFDRRLKRLLGSDAPTPLDGPAFRARLEQLAARGPELLTSEPQALIGANDGVSPWVTARPRLFASAPPAQRASVLEALDAIERAAQVTDAPAALEDAVRHLRDATPAGEPGDAARIGLEEDAAAEDFAARWVLASAQDGLEFWAAACERWLDAALARDPSQFFRVITRLHGLVAVAPRISDPSADVASPAREALARLLDDAAERGVAQLSDPNPAARFGALSALWLEATAFGGDSPAVQRLRTATRAAAEALRSASVEADRGDLQRKGDLVGDLGVDLGDFATAGLRSVEALGGSWTTEAAAPEYDAPPRPRDVEAALRLAVALVETLTVFGPASRPAAQRVLDACDLLLARSDPDGRSALRYAFPEIAAALADATAALVFSWSDPAQGAGVPNPTWSPRKPGGLVEVLSARLGSPLIDYAGRYRRHAEATPPPPVDDLGEIGLPTPALRLVSEGGDAAQRTLAANAVAAWRAHFTAALLARRGQSAAPEPISFSPYAPPGRPESPAEALALDAVSAVARAAPDASDLIGADLVWLVAQFDQLSVSAKERGKDQPAFAPAPDAVRATWAALARAEPGADPASAPPFDADGFFLFLATKLLARSQSGSGRLIGDAPAFLTASHFSIRERAGAFSVQASKWLRDYIYLERPSEKADAITAASDANMAARLDRILLFLNLITVDRTGRAASSPSDLWEARPLADDLATRFDPPDRFVKRLVAHLEADPIARGALAWTSDRAQLYFLRTWGALQAALHR